MSGWKTTFLDFPLERELYKCRPYFSDREPIRILITDAGQKFAYHLIYKICAGEVFGPNQQVYIHLVNSKGTIDHKTVFLELEECGFHLLKGWVASSNVEEVYKDVDIVVLTTNFDEQSGFTHKETFVGQIIKERHMMKYIHMYAKPNVKIVMTGSSTKYLLLQLAMMHRIESNIPAENITAVTLLDEAIARGHLAARLKTTTNKIKNIVIWGMTCPDVQNATVRTYPPGDLGALEEVEIPVQEALQDDNFIFDDLIQVVFRRKIRFEFAASGKSLALATARHLKALFGGASDDEIISMGVLTPSSEPYMVPAGMPFSFPVTVTGNGKWTIREGVRYSVGTHLNLIRTLSRIHTDRTLASINAAIDTILQYEEEHNTVIKITQKQEITNLLDLAGWDMKYYIAPLPEQAIPTTVKEKVRIRKSIAWDDSNVKGDFQRKSSIRFSSDEGKKNEKRAILSRSSDTGETLVLPPIGKSSGTSGILKSRSRMSSISETRN